MGQTIRQKQIDEQAQIRSEMCVQNVQEIYRIAFRDGAEWADKTKEDFIPEGMMPITVERSADGTVSKDLIQYLCALPASKGVIYIVNFKRSAIKDRLDYANKALRYLAFLIQNEAITHCNRAIGKVKGALNAFYVISAVCARKLHFRTRRVLVILNNNVLTRDIVLANSVNYRNIVRIGTRIEEGVSFVCVIAVLVRSCTDIANYLPVITCQNKRAYVNVVMAFTVVSALCRKAVFRRTPCKIARIFRTVGYVFAHRVGYIALIKVNKGAKGEVKVCVILYHSAHRNRERLNHISVDMAKHMRQAHMIFLNYATVAKGNDNIAL